MSEKNAAFFLHHYNEVDHRAPIIYKLAKSTNKTVDVVVSGNIDENSDYRLKFLDEFDNVNITSLNDSSGTGRGESTRGLEIAAKLKSFGRLLPTDIPEKVYNAVTQGNGKEQYQKKIESKLTELNLDENTILALDWSLNPMVEGVLNAEKDGNLAISFPHGDSSYYTTLTNRPTLANILPIESDYDGSVVQGKHFNDNVYDKNHFEEIIQSEDDSTLIEYLYKNTQPRREKYKKFDQVVVPNELTAHRWRPFIDHNSIQVLGSPRYCKEWINIISDLAPSYSPANAKDSELKLVFFLRSLPYFINPDIIKMTIIFLAQFSDIHLVVKEHTGGKLFKDLSEKFDTDYDNVSLLSNEVHSPSLLNWGDAFLSVGTSVTFQAIQQNKPVLELEYLHSNRTAAGHYMPTSVIRDFDELYDTICRLIDSGGELAIPESERGSFIENMVEPKGGDVLSNYRDLIINYNG